MKKQGSLRRRWLLNTVGVVFALGLVCVAAVTAIFSAVYYRDMQTNMENRGRDTASFFAEHMAGSRENYLEACMTYAQTFEDREITRLQFVAPSGTVLADSLGQGGPGPKTPELREAVSVRDTRAYMGEDPQTGRWIMAVSTPMIYSNGEVVGVLRYTTPTRTMNLKVLRVALYSLGVLVVVVLVVLWASSYCIRSILTPVAQITEKAKRIAGGTYGIQIKTKYNDEIGELAKTISEMSSQVAQNEKTQKEFISSLSHELRTPLTAINGWSETLLGDESLDADTQRGLKIISKEAGRLTEMVVDLLDFTRIQDGRMTLSLAPTDLRSEFEDTVFMYSSRLGQDGVRLQYLENDEEIPEIPCDAQRLRQVFLNILDNAAKHGGEGGAIEASIHWEDGFVTVYIRDFGPGIPEDELPLVKRKFYKGSSKARGSGIGLAVSDEIVQMHGGELELSNAPGGGTLVTVRLPAAQ